MTRDGCIGCSRMVTLIGGFCGHCSSTLAQGVLDGIDDLDFEAEVVDVFKADDGYIHIRIDEVEEEEVGDELEDVSGEFGGVFSDDAARRAFDMVKDFTESIDKDSK